MLLIFKEFIEVNHKKLTLTDGLSMGIAQHRKAVSILMAHYDIKQELETPMIEYARYVLAKGSDNEKTSLVSGITNKIVIKDEKLWLYRPKVETTQVSD
jgi:hypothetical protein